MQRGPHKHARPRILLPCTSIDPFNHLSVHFPIRQSIHSFIYMM